MRNLWWCYTDMSLVSDAVFLLKVDFVSGWACVSGGHKLFVWIPLAIIILNKTFEQSQRQEGVEEHHKQDVEVGVVVGSSACCGDSRGGRGCCARVISGVLMVRLDFLQNGLSAPVQQGEKQCLIRCSAT